MDRHFSGTVIDEIIDKIATEVSRDSRDCRQALSDLLRAGRNADRAGERQVVFGDLE
ncbi:hypothetical protein [Halobaculum limi]|uniref:hypothetical protein n=1 Tax=Halobaculum limi TaxID=3031916 RepID=UPI003D81157E